MRRLVAGLAALVAASGCAGELPSHGPSNAAPVAPGAPPAAALVAPAEAEPAEIPEGAATTLAPRAAMKAPYAPLVLRSTPFDYASLPLLADAVPVDVKRPPHYQLVTDASSFQLAMSGKLTAELVAGEFRTFTHGLSSREDTTVPSRGRVPCGGTDHDVIGTHWQGFDKQTRSKSAIDYVVYHGELDRSSCRAVASYQAQVRATAVVPGVMYGFRRAESEGEALVLIGPGSAWVGSTAPSLEDQIAAHVGTFSRLEVPVRRGSSASAMMQISREDFLELARKVGVDTASSLDKLLLGVWRVAVTVDVVWPEGEASPSVVVTLGAVTPPKPDPVDATPPSRAQVEGRRAPLRRR